MKRHQRHDDGDGDMLVIGSGLGGRVAALQLTMKRFRGRPSDNGLPEATWKIKRFAWAPLGINGTRRVHWLPRVMVHVGVGVSDFWRTLQRLRTGRPSTNSFAGLSWDEFIQRVALIEAEAARRPRWRGSETRR